MRSGNKLTPNKTVKSNRATKTKKPNLGTNKTERPISAKKPTLGTPKIRQKPKRRK